MFQEKCKLYDFKHCDELCIHLKISHSNILIMEKILEIILLTYLLNCFQNRLKTFKFNVAFNF